MASSTITYEESIETHLDRVDIRRVGLSLITKKGIIFKATGINLERRNPFSVDPFLIKRLDAVYMETAGGYLGVSDKAAPHAIVQHLELNFEADSWEVILPVLKRFEELEYDFYKIRQYFAWEIKPNLKKLGFKGISKTI